jgi:integrase
MPIKRLTDRTVAKLKAPPKPQQIDYWDDCLPAFGLRVSYSGSKTWVVMVRIVEKGEKKQVRIVLGRYMNFPAGAKPGVPTTMASSGTESSSGSDILTLAEARDRARRAIALAQSGKDPRRMREEQQRQIRVQSLSTFGAVRDRFLQEYCDDKNEPLKAADEYKRVLSRDFKDWDNRPIKDISRADVRERLAAFKANGTPYKANRALAYLRKMMNWATSNDILTIAPTHGIEAPAREVQRKRILTDEEIGILWKAFDEAPGTFAAFYKVLLLTGQRRGEVAGMRRGELSLDGTEPIWEIPGERTKNGETHLVPLSPLAVEIIQSVPNLGDFVFASSSRKTKSAISGFSDAKEYVEEAIARIKEERKLQHAFEKDWRPHDFRRTVATFAAKNGHHRLVVKKLLNHLDSDVTGIYDRYEYMAERRGALNLLAQHVLALTEESGKPAQKTKTKKKAAPAQAAQLRSSVRTEIGATR